MAINTSLNLSTRDLDKVVGDIMDNISKLSGNYIIFPRFSIKMGDTILISGNDEIGRTTISDNIIENLNIPYSYIEDDEVQQSTFLNYENKHLYLWDSRNLLNISAHAANNFCKKRNCIKIIITDGIFIHDLCNHVIMTSKFTNYEACKSIRELYCNNIPQDTFDKMINKIDNNNCCVISNIVEKSAKLFMLSKSSMKLDLNYFIEGVD